MQRPPLTNEQKLARTTQLLEYFRKRNLELVQENNKLRSDLELSKQQLMFMETGGNDPVLLDKVLKGMTATMMGIPMTLPLSPMPVTVSVTEAQGAPSSTKSPVQSSDFFARLERMSVPALPSPQGTGAPSEVTVETVPLPCIFAQ
jgi:hypothetical protein